MAWVQSRRKCPSCLLPKQTLDGRWGYIENAYGCIQYGWWERWKFCWRGQKGRPCCLNRFGRRWKGGGGVFEKNATSSDHCKVLDELRSGYIPVVCVSWNRATVLGWNFNRRSSFTAAEISFWPRDVVLKCTSVRWNRVSQHGAERKIEHRRM